MGNSSCAAGRIVESDRLRDMLTCIGRYRGSMEFDDGGSGGGGGGLSRGKRDAREAAEEEAPPGPPQRLSNECVRSTTLAGSPGVSRSTMARSEADKAHVVQLLGAHAQSVIVTAPVNPDGSLVPVQQGQQWLCRTFQVITAFRFTAMAVKVAVRSVRSCVPEVAEGC